jgi:hypothetical protein
VDGGKAGAGRRRGGDPAQVARLGFVIGPAAVQGAAVVPDHQVALAPAVAVDIAPLRGVQRQVGQQQPALRQRPAFDAMGGGPEEQGPASRPGMGLHQRVGHRRQGLALAGADVAEPQQLAGIGVVMDRR